MPKYNGWPNYETWAVNAHLTNEPNAYEQLMAIVQNPDTPYDQARDLREWVRFDEGAESYDLEADVLVGMSADLLAAAFDKVEWGEIIRTNSEGESDEVGSGGGLGDDAIRSN